MNKENVLEVVNDVITDVLTQLMEDMSTNEFVEMICDKLVEQGITIETDEQVDEVKEVIGSRVIPLMVKIVEYGIGKDLPKME